MRERGGEEPNFATARLDNAEPLVQALRERADLQQILTYVLSDDFLRLRQLVSCGFGSASTRASSCF